jgi:hypothetical protein
MVSASLTKNLKRLDRLQPVSMHSAKGNKGRNVEKEQSQLEQEAL